MEYKIEVLKKETTYVEADSSIEAVQKVMQRHGVASVEHVEEYNPGTPCPDCNPVGVFRYSPVGDSCKCKGSGFIAA